MQTTQITNSIPTVRAAGVLHRSAVAAVDVLGTPTLGTPSAVTEAGSTLPNSSLNITASAGNRWGNALPAATKNITPTLNQAVRISISQVAGADYYDIFISTAANPLWVGRITEAQRAAGGFIISTVGSTTAGGGAPAGSIDLGIVGTGLASNVAPFSVNNAYTPASITPIDCRGKTKARILVKVAVTDLRSLPTLVILPFLQNSLSPGDWHTPGPVTVNLLTAIQQPLEQDITLTVDGAVGLVVAISTITGQGATATIWVELE